MPECERVRLRGFVRLVKTRTFFERVDSELEPGSFNFGVAWSGSAYGVAGDVSSPAPPYRHFELWELR